MQKKTKLIRKRNVNKNTARDVQQQQSRETVAIDYMLRKRKANTNYAPASGPSSVCQEKVKKNVENFNFQHFSFT